MTADYAMEVDNVGDVFWLVVNLDLGSVGRARTWDSGYKYKKICPGSPAAAHTTTLVKEWGQAYCPGLQLVTGEVWRLG